MKSFTKLLVYSSVISVFFLIRAIETNPVWAQQSSREEFFHEGNNEINQETQKIEQEERQQQTLKEKEEKLEQELQIHQPQPQLNQIPILDDEYLGIDDDNNLPW
jgi:Tfp pilus assembly protein PilN